MKNISLILCCGLVLLTNSLTCIAGVYSATSGPFLVNTGIPISSVAVSSSTFLLNTIDIATDVIAGMNSPSFALDTQGENPVLSVVVTSVQQNPQPSELLWVTYNLNHSQSLPMTVTLQVSSDGGQTWAVPVSTASGDIGSGIMSGNGKRILWNAGVDFPGQNNSQMRVRITASDGWRTN